MAKMPSASWKTAAASRAARARASRPGRLPGLDNKAGGTIESTASNGIMATSIGRLDNAGRIAGGDNGILGAWRDQHAD